MLIIYFLFNFTLLCEGKLFPTMQTNKAIQLFCESFQNYSKLTLIIYRQSGRKKLIVAQILYNLCLFFTIFQFNFIMLKVFYWPSLSFASPFKCLMALNIWFIGTLHLLKFGNLFNFFSSRFPHLKLSLSFKFLWYSFLYFSASS